MTDPKYVGMLAGMAEWWHYHRADAPVMVVRCGHRPPHGQIRKSWCTNIIGEVKADNGVVLAMSREDHPEVQTEWVPLAATTPEELAAEAAELHAQVLRYIGSPGNGQVVYKRTSLPRMVAPLEYLTYYVCPMHGMVNINRDRLAKDVRDTLHTGRRKRTFWAVQ